MTAPAVTRVPGAVGGEAPGRVPGLDGVRGLAVLAVVLSHARVPGFHAGGMAGVHLFFVLSGFLITGLLLREYRERDRIDLPAFWGRRALRLLPALWVFLGGTIALYTLAGWGDLGELARSAFPSLLYYANFVSRDDLGIFTHTWSLGVEEQFYLTWPVVLLLLLGLARGRQAVLLGGTALLLTVSLVWRLADGNNATVPSLPHTTAFALLAGALLAIVFTAGWRPRPGLAWPVGPAAVALLLWGGRPAHALGLPDDWVHLAIVQAAASVLLIAAVCGTHAGWAGWAPLRALGVVSYGWYLWHYPLIVAADRGHLGLDPTPARALMVVVSLAVAVLSWRYVERPLLRTLRPKLERAALDHQDRDTRGVSGAA